MALESNKKELEIALNSFNKPTEIKGKEAWIRLIIYLLYIKKGTYPSNPNIGIDIRRYEFEFIDKAIPLLQNEISDQTKWFLPDVPLVSVIVDSTRVRGDTILLIILTFEDNTPDNVAVIATSAYNIIDFEVSM